MFIQKNTYLIKENIDLENLFFLNVGIACYYRTNNKMREFIQGELIGLISFLNNSKGFVDINSKIDLLVYI